MYREGRLRRVFRARGKLVAGDFVVTKGYVHGVVGFPMGDRLGSLLNSEPYRQEARAERLVVPSPL